MTSQIGKNELKGSGQVKIILAGVGGQGLVMTTDMISEAAFAAGFDVKTNDVVGLSQRGGKVWGSVIYGDKVHSPNIGLGEADILLALEPLEALRWQDYVRPGGVLLTNTSEIYPVFAIAEVAPYPSDWQMRMRKDIKVMPIDAQTIGLEIGTTKIVNVIMLGAMSSFTAISQEIWQEVIGARVPKKFLQENFDGFKRGAQAIL